MASFTKNQILNWLDKRIAESYNGSTDPNDVGKKWINLKVIRILVANDIITAAMINAAFTEFA